MTRKRREKEKRIVNKVDKESRIVWKEFRGYGRTRDEPGRHIGKYKYQLRWTNEGWR